MKFFHLSDLHIGKNVNGFSMISEQEHVFKQVISQIKTERPAAVVIAGDVYDRAVPSVDAVRLFDDFITWLEHENVAVLLISGNHDSPERINFASRLLADKGLYFYGTFDGTIHNVVLKDEYGDLNFWLLPFIKPYSLFGIYNVESYSDAVAATLETAPIDFSMRNVLISHQYYTKSGVNALRSDSELNPIGGLDAVDAGLIERFDYAALGHLHVMQQVGLEHIRYCGSPVKYSFSECRQNKSITVVELKEKGHLFVKTIPLNPLHDMREIKGPLEELINAACLADNEDYLRAILTNDNEIIDPMGKLRSIYPNIMCLAFENTRSPLPCAEITANIQITEQLSPYELFGEFFTNTQGSVMSAEQAAIVRELLGLVHTT